MCTRYHCGQFQYGHPGRRTSSCALDIIVVSIMGIRQAHLAWPDSGPMQHDLY